MGTSAVESHYQATVSGDSNRLREHSVYYSNEMCKLARAQSLLVFMTRKRLLYSITDPNHVYSQSIM
jgi:hypothetical protein